MPCVNRDDIIYNVKELPEIFSVTAGDLLLIETENGTNILDFENFILGVDNTTFGGTLSTNTTNIASLSTDFDTLSSSLTTSVKEISSSVLTTNTKALFSLTAFDTHGIKLTKSNNIASATVVNESVLRFNFKENFLNSDYLVLPSVSTINNDDELAHLVLSDINTNYVDLSVLDGATDQKVSKASSLGFKLESF